MCQHVRSIESIRVVLGLVACFFLLATPVLAQQPARTVNSARAKELAELMCRQLPNVSSVQDAVIRISDPSDSSRLRLADGGQPLEPLVWDDTYDALVQLGQYSVPCLIDRLTDTRWMPDPRMEPLMGVPVVGDVAYMILGEKGVADLLPALANKKPDEMTMGDYLYWPSVGDRRLRLQNAVRRWVAKHPNCCAAPPVVRKNTSSEPLFRMSSAEFAAAQQRFGRLRPGMNATEVLRIAGKADGTQTGRLGEPFLPGTENLALLSEGTNDHNELQAFIYFTERWTKDISRRDPLRDLYVVLYFNADGKFTRMFSNVVQIPPIFPLSGKTWQKLMWGEPKQEK